MDELKIGELVRLNLPQLLTYCSEEDPAEVVKLSDLDYCREVLKLNWPFFATPEEAERVKQEQKGKAKYWTEVHRVLGHEVQVTNHWIEGRHRAPFLLYLVDKGLIPVGVPSEVVESSIDELDHSPATKPPLGGAKYKKTPIGNPQNLVVRHVLGSLGDETFTLKDWLAVKRWFSHRCAYCSGTRQLVMDHAIPISVAALGEHRLGNLVPACHDCNAAKGKSRYDEYLRGQRDRADAAARIATIEAHMAHHGYEPLTECLKPVDADRVRDHLVELREQVAAATATTATAINAVLAER